MKKVEESSTTALMAREFIAGARRGLPLRE
jgi:hypothetical protein